MVFDLDKSTIKIFKDKGDLVGFEKPFSKQKILFREINKALLSNLSDKQLKEFYYMFKREMRNRELIS